MTKGPKTCKFFSSLLFFSQFNTANWRTKTENLHTSWYEALPKQQRFCLEFHSIKASKVGDFPISTCFSCQESAQSYTVLVSGSGQPQVSTNRWKGRRNCHKHQPLSPAQSNGLPKALAVLLFETGAMLLQTGTPPLLPLLYIYIIYVRIMYICIYLFNMYLKRFVMVTEKDLSDLLAFKWSSSWSQKHSLLSFHGFHPTQTDWHPFEFSWRESFLQRQRMTSGPQKHITTWQIPTHQPGFLLVVSPKKNSGYEKPKVIFGELGWSYIYIHYFPGNPEKKNIYIYISLANSDWN